MSDGLKKSSDDLVPRPDPSLLTTRQLQREVHGLRELLETRLVGVRDIIVTRLDGMDIAIKLLQDTADRFPARIDEKIAALKVVHEEKFSSIQTQFRERDVRAEQSSKDSKVAVDAALQAAKEAVGEQNKSSALAIAKSETSTVKQIDQLAVLIQNMTKGFDDKIGDVKDRLTRIEGKGEGTEKTRQTQQSSGSYLVAIIGVVVGLLLGVAGLLMRK